MGEWFGACRDNPIPTSVLPLKGRKCLHRDHAPSPSRVYSLETWFTPDLHGWLRFCTDVRRHGLHLWAVDPFTEGSLLCHGERCRACPNEKNS